MANDKRPVCKYYAQLVCSSRVIEKCLLHVLIQERRPLYVASLALLQSNPTTTGQIFTAQLKRVLPTRYEADENETHPPKLDNIADMFRLSAAGGIALDELHIR